MADTLEISVPTELSDIKLEQYQEWVKIVEATKDEEDKEDFLNRALIEVFCGVSLTDIAKIKATEFHKILGVLEETFSKETNGLVKRFVIDGVEYGFEPNIQEIKTAAYVDAEASLVSWDNFNIAMAALYRPITRTRTAAGVEQYEIEDYNPTDEKSLVMLNAPLDAVLSAKVFFCDLGMELSQITLIYLEGEMKKEQDIQQKKILEQSGDGINQYIRSLEEMHSSLMKQHPYHYCKR